MTRTKRNTQARTFQNLKNAAIAKVVVAFFMVAVFAVAWLTT